MIDPETATKISFLKKSNFKDLKKTIPETQLEEKLGGTLPNFIQYWYFYLIYQIEFNLGLQQTNLKI